MTRKNYQNENERNKYLESIRNKMQTCQCCGRSFYSLTFSPACSRRCQERMKRILNGHTFKKDNCINCGAEYAVKRSDAYFCSNKCRTTFRKTTVSTPNAQNINTCKMCGKSFYSTRKYCNYCSLACYNGWLKRTGYFHKHYLSGKEIN
jgi:hypothetical protein